MTAPELPAEVAAHPLREEAAWLALRDGGIVPIDVTEMVTTQQARDEFLVGCWLLNKVTKKAGGLLGNIQPQMLQVTDMLAAGKLLNAVIEPRRSSKTTTLFCVLMGRCYLQEVYVSGFTLATTQKKTAERYRQDIYTPIVRQWPDEATRPVKVYKGNGTERVEFPATSSVFTAYSPEGEAFRSGAYDSILVDESGVASVDLGLEIKTAVLPTFDTRDDAQFIFAGTAAKFRAGNILWDMLHNPKAGRLRYTVPDGIDPEELESWEPTEETPRGHVRELVEGMHPGLQGLTTLDRIETNYEELGIEQFSLEYLGLFGMEGSNVGLIPAPQFEAALLDEPMPQPPKSFTMALAVHPDRLWSSIAVAWKRKDGHVVVGLLHHQDGVQGLSQKALGFARKYKVGVIYDSGSTAAAVEMEALTRASPKPKLIPMMTGDVRRAATKVLKHLDEGTLHHYGQPQLTSAAEVAVKRAIGNAGGFGFGRPKAQPGADITPVEAASLAVHQLDDERPSQKPEIVFGA